MSFTSRIAAAAARGYGMFAAVARAVDPFFNYVTALLHGDGTNGAQNNTFLDSSTNNFTITRNGNTTQGTFSPFSQTGWSNYFDGTGDYLTIADNAAFAFGSGDFTVEFWLYNTGTDGFLVSQTDNSTAPGSSFLIYITSGALQTIVYYGSSFASITAGSSFPLNQWTHVALVRATTTLTMYVNGASVGTTALSTNSLNDSSAAIAIGARNNGNNPITGYISNVRIVKGTAVYTANFTPPTAPLTAITNTSLLTCQSNRFIDNSTNNFTITRNGDTSVQAFSPFNPTSAWSASSNGGSGYFDGSGDYLTVAANTAFDVSASAYTFETWVYFTTAPSVTIMFGLNGTGITGYANLLYSGGTLYWQQRGTSTNQTTYTWSPTLGQWYHIAIGWNGSNSLAMWINGTRVATNTVSPTGAGQNGINFGAASDGYAVGGYMSNFRLVKGADVYGVGNATITVPTAPLTAISNTSFLLNFTNAGIYDNAAVGDYETVGNAQVSTSVVKYGTGSMYFDGTGDYLIANTPVKNVYALGAGDFTIECWVYFNSISNTPQFISGYAPPSTTTYNWAFYLPATGTLAYYLSSTGTTWDIANGVSFGTTFTTGVWYHIALVRVGNKITPYVNGNAGTSTTSTATIYNNNGPIYVGGISTYVLNGYIDDFRFTKGVGRYPYNFTPPTAAFPNIGGTVTLTADPYFRNTTLLLPGNGTNGAQNNTFLDSSSNAFTITRNGNTTQGTFTPFSQTGWGNYFDGSGDYLQLADSTAWDLAGDFTIEMWLYKTSTTSQTFFMLGAGGSTSILMYQNASNVIIFLTNSAVITASTAAQLNTWNHVALVRSGSTITLYLNGTSVGQATNATSFTGDAANGVRIGAEYPTGFEFTGYISNLRIVKGTAVYTANFTPSTTPLTAITNTSLLTCQSNRFVDNSTNNFTITRNGDTSVQAFSPFAPTAAYSASTVGGSGYFDGSGDYLSVANNSAFNLGTNSFCIDGWFYPTTTNATQLVFNKWGTVSDTQSMFQIGRISSTFYAQLKTTGGYVTLSTSTWIPNAWNHFAVVRSGSTISAYLNGARFGTDTTNPTLNSGTDTMTIGSKQAQDYFTGYITDCRIVNGSAIYDPTQTTITVPTAPTTAVTNTAFLSSNTNGGITDATAKNDLETVGNAQISTTQSKFGGSSMLFDGTGDWLAAADSRNFDLGSGDWTIEGWLYINTAKNYNGWYGKRQTSLYGLTLQIDSSGVLSISASTTGSSWALAGASLGSGYSTGAWMHVAVTRFGTTITGWRNGISTGTQTLSGSIFPATGYAATIGSANDTGQDFNGYIDDFRITKGIARYTSNFTPPTSAFLTL